MRRTALLVGAWLLAGTAAVAAATAAVSLVGREVTGSRPAALSAQEVAEELAARPPTSTTDGSASTTTPADGPDAPTTTLGGTTATTAPVVTTAPPPPVATTAPPPPASETRTYTLIGGTVTIRFSTSGATVVAATPNAGFDVDSDPEHGNGVKVEFESDAHKSRVSAWWDNGPREEVREEPDS